MSGRDLTKIMEMLKSGVDRVAGEKEMKDYLNAVSRFPDYSPANCLLISMQMPDASLVAGYSTWKKDFGRSVRRGERGIRIVAPSMHSREVYDDSEGMYRTVKVPAFRSVTVFDVSQTEGRELPELRLDLLKGSLKDFDSVMEVIAEVSPVPIYIEDIKGGRNGYYDHGKKRIGISASMSEAQMIKTAVHELAHVYLREMTSGKREDRSASEAQAESIAYCVCRHFGLDTSDYSFKYIAAWKSMIKENGMDILRSVRDVSGKLIESIGEKALQKDICLAEEQFMSLEKTGREGDGHVR